MIDEKILEEIIVDLVELSDHVVDDMNEENCKKIEKIIHSIVSLTEEKDKDDDLADYHAKQIQKLSQKIRGGAGNQEALKKRRAHHQRMLSTYRFD